MSKQVSSLISATTDFTRHIERLRHLPAHPIKELRSFFDRDLPIHVARAPGRLDVMGGIGDYSGSLVLEMPIAEAAFVAVQPLREEGVRIVSLSQDESTTHRFFSLSASDFARLTQSDYDAICKELRREPDSSWAAYVLGPLFVLLKATDAKLCGGLRILIDSQVPEGKGVSSSAAIEVATMRALAALLQIRAAGGRTRAALPSRRESSCRRTVRNHGSNDISAWSSKLAARASLPAGDH